MKIDFIADTNFLIYVHEGNEYVAPLLELSFGISFISELELLGFKGISPSQEEALNRLISKCIYFDWNERIKNQTLNLSRKYSIKLPDAIIAATCIDLQVPLISADKEFAKIQELDFVQLDLE